MHNWFAEQTWCTSTTVIRSSPSRSSRQVQHNKYTLTAHTMNVCLTNLKMRVAFVAMIHSSSLNCLSSLWQRWSRNLDWSAVEAEPCSSWLLEDARSPQSFYRNSFFIAMYVFFASFMCLYCLRKQFDCLLKVYI